MSNMTRFADVDGFGLPEQPMTLTASAPVLIGGGTAATVAAGVRGIAAPGTWVSRRAGTIGAASGALVSLASKQGAPGLAAALITGGFVELMEWLTGWKMTSKG